jgi:hypothetical protein
MGNHHLGLVKKKMIIFLTKLMTKNPQSIDIKIYIFPHFIQEEWNLVGFTFNPNIHCKLLKTPLHEF